MTIGRFFGGHCSYDEDIVDDEDNENDEVKDIGDEMKIMQRRSEDNVCRWCGWR